MGYYKVQLVSSREKQKNNKRGLKRGKGGIIKT